MITVVALAMMLLRCEEPDDRIPANVRALDAGAPCKRASIDDVRSNAPTNRLPRARVLPPAQRVAVQRSLNRLLLDAPTARVQWPRQVGRSDVYCLWVNGKNRMGAYAGWRQMIATFKRDGSAVVDENAPLLEWGGKDQCADAGYDTSPA